MGQQQILLIMLSVIVVGVAVAVGIVLFRSNAIEQKRNEIINELTLLASEAQLYYRKPTAMGGGNKSFVGWRIPEAYSETEVGYFVEASIQPEQVIITGTGNEIVTDTDSIQVQMIVSRDSIQAVVIH